MSNRVSIFVYWLMGAANLALTVLLLVLLFNGFKGEMNVTAISGVAAALSVSIFSWIGWLRQNDESKREKAARSTAEIQYYYQSGLSDSVFAMDILAKEVWNQYERRKNKQKIPKEILMASIVFITLCRLSKTIKYFGNLFPEKIRVKMENIPFGDNEEFLIDRDEISAFIKVLSEAAIRIKHERERLQSLIESNNVSPESFYPILEKIQTTDNAFRPISKSINNLDQIME